MSARRFEFPVLLSAGLFVAGLAFAVWTIAQGTGGTLVYGLDDAYIHMAIGKNLARHAVWGTTPFHFASASSSLLWTALVGLAYFLTGVRDLTPLVLNAVFAVASLVIADRYLKRWGASLGLRVTALIGLSLAGPLPGLAVLGMEHVLHILLTIWFAGAAIEALASPMGPDPTRQSGLLSDEWGLARSRFLPSARNTALFVLGTLLATSRYEGLFLVGIVSVAFLIQRRWTTGVLLGSVSALPTILFGFLSLSNGWMFFPNSLLLKAGGEDISLVTALLKPIGKLDAQFFADNDDLFILVMLGLAGAIVQWRDRRTPWRPQVLAPLFLALMIFLHGHYAFTSMFWEYRYAAYLGAFGVFAAAALLTDYWNTAPNEESGRVTGLASLAGLVAVIWLVTDIQNGLFSTLETDAAISTHQGHVKPAQFLQRYYPRSTVVVNDLGTVTYFTDARILDMFGLGDIEPIRIRRSKGGEYTAADIDDWTGAHRPAIAILQIGWGWVIPRIPDRWVRVAEVQMPAEGEFIGFFAVDRAEAPRLRAYLEEFYGPLTAQGYKVNLHGVE